MTALESCVGSEPEGNALFDLPSIPAGTHHEQRRHSGILPGPTRGHQPTVWGYLFELLVEFRSIEVTADRELPRHVVNELADRMVLRTETTREAFRWLLKHDLVAVEATPQGCFASADIDALRQLVQRQARQVGAAPTATVTYFRARYFWARAQWLAYVLDMEES